VVKKTGFSPVVSCD